MSMYVPEIKEEVSENAKILVVEEDGKVYRASKSIGGVKNWDELEGKPFEEYTVDEREELIFPATKVSNDEKLSSYHAEFAEHSFIDGEKYTVVMDGVEYVSIAVVERQLMDVTYNPLISYLGNYAIDGYYDSNYINDTEEPFYINLKLGSIKFADGGTHTIEIYKGAITTVVKQIPKRFIPLSAVAYRYYGGSWYDADDNKLSDITKEEIINNFMNGIVRIKTSNNPSSGWGTMVGYYYYNGYFTIKYNPETSSAGTSTVTTSWN